MNLFSTKTLLTMKDYCFPNSTTFISTKKIKQFFLLFSPLLLKLLSFIFAFLLVLLALVFSFFSGANLSSLMENLRPRFEAPDEEYHDFELECFVDLVGVESAPATLFHDHGGASGSLGKNLVEFSLKVEENQDEEDKRSEDEVKIGLAVANHKAMELNLSSLTTSFNGGSHAQQTPIIKTHSFRHDTTDTNYDNSHASEHHSDQPIISHTLSDLGSATRKEKEWRRTLACKLFQERHNVGGDGSIACGGAGGGEGMDMLWEVYERTEEENKGKQGEVSDEKEEMGKNNKSRIVDYLEELEEEEGEEVNLCCLKALKFSAGKMHFGMARPGFLSFSKAVKGIRTGWSNHHHQRKKKV